MACSHAGWLPAAPPLALQRCLAHPGRATTPAWLTRLTQSRAIGRRAGASGASATESLRQQRATRTLHPAATRGPHQTLCIRAHISELCAYSHKVHIRVRSREKLRHHYLSWYLLMRVLATDQLSACRWGCHTGCSNTNSAFINPCDEGTS